MATRDWLGDALGVGGIRLSEEWGSPTYGATLTASGVQRLAEENRVTHPTGPAPYSRYRGGLSY